MNHLIHAHDVTKRVTRIGEPISGTYRTLKSNIDTTIYTPTQSSAGFVGTDEIYSKFDEGGNSIHTYYNGVIFYIVKQISGLPAEYVTLPFTVIANNPYTVVTELKSDWTCQLTVNGVPAQAGLGIEKLTNPDFALATGWTVDVNWSITGGKALLSSNGTGSNGLYQSPNTAKKVYLITANVESVSGAGVGIYIDGTVFGHIRTTPGLLSNNGEIISNIYASFGNTVGSVCSATIDNASCKEVFNNTTTLAPTYRGHLGG